MTTGNLLAIFIIILITCFAAYCFLASDESDTPYRND